ncbi:MAG: hypothetical protein ACT4P4_25935 [Betaproteobacteria bacterium]
MVREEKWVPDGCVCVRVDSRGAGRSPGTLCHNNAASRDAYRESARHGGILCTFRKNWQDMQVKTVQHGFAGGKKNPNTGVAVCGDEILSEAELEKNRENMWQAFLSRELWQFRRLHAGRLEAEVARGARRLALGALLYRLRHGPAEAVL